METHSRKYKPGLQTLREQTFCANCHDLKSPLSGDNIFSLQDEWRASEAAARGVSCQGCHMKKSVNGLSYHGFDSAHRDATIYEGDLRISNAELQFPHFSLVLENRITGHAVPPSGPTRMLVMKITFLDAQGIVQHDEEKVFGKKFELMPLVGLFPNRLILNTQLQISEARRLRFALPASLDKQINRAVVSLRFYGVSDEHQGDITRAHWISDPILVEEFLF